MERTRSGQVFREWVAMCLVDNIPMRFSGEERDRLYIRTSALEAEQLPQAFMEGNYKRGWTSKPGSDELRLTAEGLALLSSEVRTKVERRATFGVLEYWMAQNGALIEGHSMRAATLEEKRGEVQAILQRDEGEVLLRLTLCRDLFGKVPKANLRRVGTMQYVSVNLNDSEGFIEALDGAQVEREESGRSSQVPLGSSGVPLPFREAAATARPAWMHAEVEGLSDAGQLTEEQEYGEREE